MSGTLPKSYVGLPLNVYTLQLNEGKHAAPVILISTDAQIALLNSYRQYFIKRNGADFVPQPGDVVLDCGACIGEISAIIAGLTGPEGQVHLFDPVPLHAEYCYLQAKLNPAFKNNIHMNILGVSDTTKTMTGTRQNSSMINPGSLTIDAFSLISLDDYVAQKNLTRVDMIKMDIEGAEMAALKGAEQLIRRFKPKLAISAYHKPEDLWEIPLKIKELHPDYRLYFGHHTPIDWESVFYAI